MKEGSPGPPPPELAEDTAQCHIGEWDQQKRRVHSQGQGDTQKHVLGPGASFMTPIVAGGRVQVTGHGEITEVRSPQAAWVMIHIPQQAGIDGAARGHETTLVIQVEGACGNVWTTQRSSVSQAEAEQGARNTGGEE